MDWKMLIATIAGLGVVCLLLLGIGLCMAAKHGDAQLLDASDDLLP